LYDHKIVTHIVTSGKDYESNSFINKSINHDVNKVPLRIKIVRWEWVSDCGRRGEIVEPTRGRYVQLSRWEQDWEASGGEDQGALIKSRRRTQPAERIPLDSEEEEEMA
jgi:hypothetical protein